jgi:hypothetical protein
MRCDNARIGTSFLDGITTARIALLRGAFHGGLAQLGTRITAACPPQE